jgi:hypothetical protein
MKGTMLIFSPGPGAHRPPDRVLDLSAPPSIETLHDAVGGYIEAVPFFLTNVMERNENVKLDNLPLNEAATTCGGWPYDVSNETQTKSQKTTWSVPLPFCLATPSSWERCEMSTVLADPQKRTAAEDAFLADKARVINDLASKVVPNMIEMGRHLQEAKDEVGHGKYLPWLKTIGLSQTGALRLIHLFKRWGANPSHVADLKLPMVELSRLAAPETPDEATEEALALTRGGEVLNRAKVGEIVSRAKSASGKRAREPTQGARKAARPIDENQLAREESVWRSRMKELVGLHITAPQKIQAARQEAKATNTTLTQWLGTAIADARKLKALCDEYVEAYEREVG